MSRLLMPTALAITLVFTSPAAAQGAGAPTPSPTPVPTTSAERTADRVVEAVWQWNLKKAATILANSKDRDGSDPQYKAAQGFLLAAEGKPQQGLAQLAGETKTAGGGAAIPFLHGEVLYWQQQYKEADAAWRTAFQRAQAAADAAPTDARAQFYLGAAAAKLKKHDVAKRALDRAASLGFAPVLVDYQRGINEFLAEEWESAKDAFGTAIDADGKFAYSYFYRGLVWSKLGRKDNMLLDLDKFVKLAPTAPDVATARAILSAYGG